MSDSNGVRTGWLSGFAYWLRTYWLFKVTLPRLRECELDGVKLDLSDLSLVMRNRVALGRYEVQERRLVGRFLNAQDAVLEIGGAIGFIGLYCQKRLGITRYATVEANPRTADILRRNYAINGFQPLLINAALADHDGDVCMEVGGEFWGNSIVLGEGRAVGQRIGVPAMTLTTLLKTIGFPVNALIIDIEGAEKYIDWRAVPPGVNKIVMELHPDIITTPETFRIITDLVKLGFSVQASDDGTYFFGR